MRPHTNSKSLRHVGHMMGRERGKKGENNHQVSWVLGPLCVRASCVRELESGSGFVRHLEGGIGRIQGLNATIPVYTKSNGELTLWSELMAIPIWKNASLNRTHPLCLCGNPCSTLAALRSSYTEIAEYLKKRHRWVITPLFIFTCFITSATYDT